MNEQNQIKVPEIPIPLIVPLNYEKIEIPDVSDLVKDKKEEAPKKKQKPCPNCGGYHGI